MRVIVVEDEYLTAAGLQSLLTGMDPDVEVLTISRSVSEYVEWFGSHPESDLASMDIHLADGPVFSPFERVEITCSIIFMTAYRKYALKAFEVDSIDYLLKPTKGTDLQRALKKVGRFSYMERRIDNRALVAKMMQMLNEPQMSYESRFPIPWRGKLIPISVDKIAYIHADSKASVVAIMDRREHFVDLLLEKMAQEPSLRLFF